MRIEPTDLPPVFVVYEKDTHRFWTVMQSQDDVENFCRTYSRGFDFEWIEVIPRKVVV